MVELIHICYIIWKFKSPKNFIGMGGAENQLLKIIEHLKNNSKIKITIITKQTPNDLVYEKIAVNKEIIRLNVANIPLISMIIFTISAFFMLLKINKRNGINIIHVPLPDFFIIILNFFSKIMRIPVINRIAADELYPKNKGNFWFINRIIVRKLMLKLDGIQVLNPIAKNYAKYLKYPDERIFLIPNGTKIPNKYNIYNDFTYNLLYIGAMRYHPEKEKTEQKNLLFLIDAFYELAKRDNRLKLIMVGDGNYRTTLESKVKEYNIEKKIEFTGYQRNIQKYHLKSDIFINPSWKEGMPNTVVEAMASGMVVFCSDIPEHRFLIKSNLIGILFDPNDKENLVKKIINLYENKNDFQKISENARSYIKENLSIEKTVKAIIDMYSFYLH